MSQPESESEKHSPDWGEVPELVTSAYHHFYLDQIQLNSFIGFMSDMAVRADKQTSEHSAVKRLRAFGPLVYQMMICRGVDNFLTYLSELLATIFRVRPETLRSNETIAVEDVLQHQSMESLVAYVADRKVHQLSYKGIEGLTRHLDERLGLVIFETPDHLAKANLLVEFRNLIVHNRGTVNDVFLNRVRSDKWKIGSAIELDKAQTTDAIRFLSRAASDIDIRAFAKFDLPRPYGYGGLGTWILKVENPGMVL